MSASKHFRSMVGAVTVAMGVIVMLGWIFQIRRIVSFNGGNIVMVLDAAVGFILVGVAILCATFKPAKSIALQIFIGWLLTLFGSAIVVEFLLGRSLGIDWTTLHEWLKNGNRLPGRMAPNAAVGFIATGLVLVFQDRVTSHWQSRGILSLTFGIVAIGVTGLIGFQLSPDLLFDWASSERMAVPTAVGFVLVGLACWGQLHEKEWYGKREHFRDDDKILFVAAAIMTVVTLTAGLSGFSLQETTLEHLLQQAMASNLDSRVVAFQRTIDEIVASASDDAKRDSVVELTRELSRHGKASPQSSHKETDLLTQLGVESIAIYDLSHRGLLLLGTQGHGGKLLARMNLPIPTNLYWEGGLIAETVSSVIDGENRIGEIVLRRSLRNVLAALLDVRDLGSSGEVLICSDSGGNLICLPSRRNPNVSTHERLGSFGNPLPMALAASGKDGTVATTDYLGHNVNAAFRQLAPGLGIAIKQDAAELYSPIRDKFMAATLMLVFLVLLGVGILRMQIRPLARRIIDAEISASEKEQQIRTLLNNVGEGILSASMDGTIDSCNPAACEIFGVEEDMVRGTPLYQFVPAFVSRGSGETMRVVVDGDERQILGERNVELTGRRLDGTSFPLELTMNAMSVHGRQSYVAIVRDISKRKETEFKLNHLARFDTLTGLPNRAQFMERLAEALTRYRRHGLPLALMFLDLDGFKGINDTLGHQSGDELLKQFACRLSSIVRKSDTVARLGGDEFTIILECVVEGEEDATAVGQKIVTRMREPFKLGDVERMISTSIGIAVQSHGDTALEELLNRADTAMYRAKRSGKNQLCVCSGAAS